MTNNQEIAVMSVSGGLDSTTLLHYAVKTLEYRVFALAFDYGQRHRYELLCAQRQCSKLDVPLRVLDLSELEMIGGRMSALINTQLRLPTIQEAMGDPQPASYVPNRNMLFLSYAVAYAESLGARHVLYGAQKHDTYGYWDTTQEFVQALNGVYRLNRKSKIVVEAPFVNKSKADEILLGLELGVNYRDTWSCYQGHARACGKCATCSERLKAFMDVGIPDPLEYEYLPETYTRSFKSQPFASLLGVPSSEHLTSDSSSFRDNDDQSVSSSTTVSPTTTDNAELQA